MDEHYKKMKDDTEVGVEAVIEGVSQIEQFYAGKKILLTGCTGYIGKCVVEKLLRTCTEVDTIYTLVRPKKQMTVQERMDKYFSDVIFDVLRKENPNFSKKIQPIESDLVKADLGLSPENRQLLIENTNIVIHNAACVYFEAKPSVSLRINVLSTQALLELAAECNHMKAFLYVSTAYSHPYIEKVIDEEFYSPPGDLKMIEDMIQADEENETGLNASVVKDMLGHWPNIYTFGKATSESLVEKFGKKASFPCGVYRPTVVTPTCKEPLVSWTANSNGPIMAMIMACMGFMHVAYVHNETTLDLIPADMTTNALLAIVWDLAVYRKPKEPKVFNYGTSKLNPVRMKVVSELLGKTSMLYPSVKTMWYYSLYLCQNFSTFMILHILLHFIPCVLIDLVQILQMKKPFALSIFSKFNQNMPWMFKFANGNWLIETNSVQDIWTRMTPADHEKFYTDVRVIEWEHYTMICWKGVRVYLLNDPMDSMPIAQKKYKRLMILHYSIVWPFRLFLLYLMYLLVCYIFNF